MAVLVTGATGFVGAKLARELVNRGEQVRVLHRPSSSLAELNGVKIVSCLGDVTNLASVRDACRGVDTVYHLAGVVGYSKAMRSVMDDVNVQGTQNVIEAMQIVPNAKLVYMSSVVTIGASFDRRRLNESSPYSLKHLNLGYFETKRIGEEYVIQATRQGRLEAVILNPSTIYGAADAKKGSRKTQIQVARGKLPFYTSGGVSVVSVHDVVAAVLRAREVGRSGERYILSGENLTIYELFQRIAQLSGVNPPSIYLPNSVVLGLGKLGDLLEKYGKKGPLNSERAWTSILYHWFDNSKAKRELEFKPRPAQEALSESVTWMKENGIL